MSLVAGGAGGGRWGLGGSSGGWGVGRSSGRFVLRSSGNRSWLGTSGLVDGVVDSFNFPVNVLDRAAVVGRGEGGAGKGGNGQCESGTHIERVRFVWCG